MRLVKRIFQQRTLFAFLAGWLTLAAATQAEETTRQVEHALGVTEIQGTPTRIVTLYQGANDTAVALGVTPIAVVDSWVEKPMYHYLRDDLANVPHVGLETQPNLEEIARLKPDLIIANKARHEDIYTLLSQIAPTVAEDTVFDFKGTVQLMGEALNKQAEADQLLADWNQRVATLQTELQAQVGDQWPLQVAITNVRNDHLRVYLEDSFAGTVLHDLGFEFPPMSAQRTWGVKLNSKENIPSMNADVMFIIFQSQDGSVHENYQAWSDHPLWQTLDATQNNQVYDVDLVAWLMSGGIIGANNMMDQLYTHFGIQS